MIDVALAVLTPFVSKLTEDFLDRRRGAVKTAELQDQVVRLMGDHRELEIEVAQTQKAVIALTRYLAFTQGEAFVFKGDRLELAISADGQRDEVVGNAIGNFHRAVAEICAQRGGRPPGAPGQPRPQSSQPKASGSSTSDSRAASPDALDRFFEGFEEEVMKARLGQEEAK
jgi:hypothetical protein